MTRYSRDYYRTRAIQRQRDPEQDAKNAAAREAIRLRVEAALAGVPQIQALNAAAERAAAESTWGTC